MFVGLDRLPDDQAMFTVYVEVPVHGFQEVEEVDVVADRNATADQVIEKVDLDEEFLPGAKVIGVVSQSSGAVLLDRR